MATITARRFVCGVAAPLLLAGCTGAPVVGVLRPASGEAEAYGTAVASGIQVAVDEAVRRAGLPDGFAVLEVDTASNPEVAAAEFRRLVEESRVRLVVGGMTADEATALVPVVDDTRVICLSPSVASMDIGRGSRYFYRLFATDEAEGQTAARHLYDTLGVRDVVVYTDDSVWTRGVESEFRQHFELNLQGKIVSTIHLDDKRWQRLSVDSLHANHPQAVYVVGHAERILEVLEHLESASFEGVRATTSTFYLADVVRRGAETAEGVIFPLSAYDAASVEQPLQSFVTDYRSRFGHDPDIFAAHGYDAMRVAIHALANTPALYSDEIKKFMSFELNNFRGATGPIAFDDHGDATRYPVMHCVYQGRVMSSARSLDIKRKAIADKLRDLLKTASPSKMRNHRLSA